MSQESCFLTSSQEQDLNEVIVGGLDLIDPTSYSILDNMYPPDSTELMQFEQNNVSAPATEDWTGDFGFSVTFGNNGDGKNASATFSEMLSKLFVRQKIGVAALVSVTSDLSSVAGSFIVRAMAVFSETKDQMEVVKRCPNHSGKFEPTNHGAFELYSEHLIRCNSQLAQYDDQAFSRQSVWVPYEAPQGGSTHTKYIYQFMCLQTCVGGLNRRPINVIFTLEQNGEVVGRKCIPVRICACPGRDKKTAEDKLIGGGPAVPQRAKKRKMVPEPAAAQPRSQENEAGDRLITVNLTMKQKHLRKMLAYRRFLQMEERDTEFNKELDEEMRSVQSTSTGSQTGSRPSLSRQNSLTRPSTSGQSSTICQLQSTNPTDDSSDVISSQEWEISKNRKTKR